MAAKRAATKKKNETTADSKAKAAERIKHHEEVVDFDPMSVAGWTLKRVQYALEAIDRGEMGPGHELMLAMTKDPEIKRCLKLRQDTFTQVPMYFEKPPGLPQDYFDEWVTWWQRCWPRASQGLSNQHKICLGLGPLNVTWKLRDDQRYWRPTVHVKEPLCVEWYEWRRIYRFQARSGAEMPDGSPGPDYTKEALGTAASAPGLLDMWPLDGTRWLMLQEEPLRPHQHGALRSLAAAWYMGAEALRWWNAHNRKHGIEWLGVKIPAAQRESEDAEALLDACVKLENGGVCPLPQFEDGKPSYGLEVFAAKTEASKTFAGLIELADQYKCLLLLGAQENTNAGGGSLAKSKTADRVALRLTKGDCGGAIEVHDTLARTACEVNGFDPDDAPKLFAQVDVPEDEALKAQRLEQQGAAAQAISAVLEKLEAANAARAAAKQPLIEFEPDYLFEQVGLMLTRAQDGQQTRPG